MLRIRCLTTTVCRRNTLYCSHTTCGMSYPAGAWYDTQPQVRSELRGVKDRSLAMLAHYPGNGSHYVRHCDNHCNSGEGDECNGRRVTAIV